MKRWLRRWGWVLLVIPLAAGFLRLRFDVEVLSLLPSELPAVEGLKLYQRHFANAHELIVTVSAPDAEAARAAAQTLAARWRAQTNRVRSVIWQPPLTEDPAQAAELIAYLWLNQPPEVFRELTNRLAPERLGAVLAATRAELTTSLSPQDIARLSYDPFGFTQLPRLNQGANPALDQGDEAFSSADGKFRVLFVQAAMELGSYRAKAAWLNSLQEQAEAAKRSGLIATDVRVRFTGGPAFVTEISAGMERDTKQSAFGTLVIIALLFWWAHRRWRPLLWLMATLLLVLAGTLSLGGLVFGEINVVSLGFAAILLGLAVDYGLVLYQEAVAETSLDLRSLRATLTPSIVWSAATTAFAFGLLGFAGLPGLAQLGALVAIGVILAAVVMLYVFLPLIYSAARVAAGIEVTGAPSSTRPVGRVPWLATIFLALACAVVLTMRRPALDRSADSLQPVHSEANAALTELKSRLSESGDPLWLLANGRDESEVARRLAATERALRDMPTGPGQWRFSLPTAMWPAPEHQQSNRAAAAALAAQRPHLHAAATNGGFNLAAVALSDSLCAKWQSAATETGVIWPTNTFCRWIVSKFSARTEDGWLALGVVYAPTNRAASERISNATLTARLPAGVTLTDWTLLGEVVLRHVESRIGWLLLAMLLAVSGCLWLTFRRVGEVLLSFATLGFGLALLLAIMGVAGWSWNLMNLAALPLLLGSGVDYTIHVQLALGRHRGNVSRVRQSTGRAVLLCAGTTVAGFGSLASSSNDGLASLGAVCATGIACVCGVSLGLLPAWWRKLRRSELANGNGNDSQAAPGPSTAYRVEVWKLGLSIIRRLPPRAADVLAMVAAVIYCRVRPSRVDVVTENLLPVFGGDRKAAETTARRLFTRFAGKIVDLWRYESGVSVDGMVRQGSGWEILEKARSSGRGILLITPHLGNWEFGGPLLIRHHIPLLVLTQPEPGNGFTELRQQSRARWGIETLVVRADPFAFVEVIKRLQAGAVVALLVDRPPAPTAVTVELFGRPFRASIAAAELARTTGCALLPVLMIREADGYAARLLPEIEYDRGALGDREARQRLTQKIMRAFEPVIRQHPDQWYHFVPLWSDGGPGQG